MVRIVVAAEGDLGAEHVVEEEVLEVVDLDSDVEEEVDLAGTVKAEGLGADAGSEDEGLAGSEKVGLVVVH